MLNSLDAVRDNLDPTDFEYRPMMANDLLLPPNKITLLPENMTTVCNCQQCATKRCNCRNLSINCSKFCKCMDETVEEEPDECKNPYT